MHYKSIKVNIITTLFILMMISALLTNFVVLMFWQKEMIRSYHNGAIHVIDLMYKTGNIERINRDEDINISDQMHALCSNIGEQCIDAVYYNGNDLSKGKLNDLRVDIEKVALEVSMTGKESEKLVGTIWGTFLLSKRYLLIGMPLLEAEQSDHSIVAVIKLESIYQYLRNEQKTILVYLFVNVLILSIVGGFRLYKLVVKPLDRIISVSESYQDFRDLFLSDNKDRSEFGRLNRALNKLLSRIESDKNKLQKTVDSLEAANLEIVRSHKEVVWAEKLASVGRLSAGFAHEIGNPISIIQGYIELLQKSDLDEKKKEQYSKRALDELERINKLIRQLLNFARTSPEKESLISIDENLFNNIFEIVRLEKERSDIEITSHFSGELVVKGDKEGLRQVMLNCMLNAIDAIRDRYDNRGKGSITIEACRQEAETENLSDRVLITIRDNGIGVSDDEINNVFDPFFSTKSVGQGTGLGLYVSHSIIESFAGQMWLEPNKDAGVTIFISLPFYYESSG